MNNKWELKSGLSILLLKPEELRALPPFTYITSINGETRKVLEPGQQPADDDTRFGHTAWGITPPELLKELKLI